MVEKRPNAVDGLLQAAQDPKVRARWILVRTFGRLGAVLAEKRPDVIGSAVQILRPEGTDAVWPLLSAWESENSVSSVRYGQLVW